MNHKLKRRWVNALRSGNFKQCCCDLYSDGEHCALGVLAVVADIKIEDGPESVQTYTELRQALGIEPSVIYTLNDNANPFEVIADWVEANL